MKSVSKKELSKTNDDYISVKTRILIVLESNIEDKNKPFNSRKTKPNKNNKKH